MYQMPFNPDDERMTHIDTDKEFEVTYWARRFGIPKAELREVIDQVGNHITLVRRRIDGRQKLAA